MGEPSGAPAPKGKADALPFPKHDPNLLRKPIGAILPLITPEHQDNLLGNSVSSPSHLTRGETGLTKHWRVEI
jgi:hypothetical protein